MKFCIKGFEEKVIFVGEFEKRIIFIKLLLKESVA